MTSVLEGQILGVFLLFCRIGGCLLVAPGLASQRIPVQVRLFAALAVTAAAGSLALPEILQKIDQLPPDRQMLLIPKETLIGVLLGLMARCFILALQFATNAMSNFIGLSGIPGIPLEEPDTGSPLTTLVSAATVTLIFGAGLHMELIRAVFDSYVVIPAGSTLTAQTVLTNLLRSLNETWLLALRLAGPFLAYGVIVNAALGMGNRFAQQISLYHATTGVVMLGGLLLLYLVWFDWVTVFLDAYRSWLAEGGF